MELYKIEVPEDYWPKRMSPDTEKAQQVMALIKANFKRGELWPCSVFEDRMSGSMKPFVLRRYISTLWSHGLLEKWVGGVYIRSRNNIKKQGGIGFNLGQATRNVGQYWGVHYKWI